MLPYDVRYTEDGFVGACYSLSDLIFMFKPMLQISDLLGPKLLGHTPTCWLFLAVRRSQDHESDRAKLSNEYR